MIEQDAWISGFPADGDPGDIVCELPSDDAPASRRRWRANADLIAAAPDLYQALKALRDVSPLGVCPRMDAARQAADAALAKANGRA